MIGKLFVIKKLSKIQQHLLIFLIQTIVKNGGSASAYFAKQALKFVIRNGQEELSEQIAEMIFQVTVTLDDKKSWEDQSSWTISELVLLLPQRPRVGYDVMLTIL